MQKIHSLNLPVVTGICDPNKSWAQHLCSLKLGSKLKYLNFLLYYTIIRLYYSSMVIYMGHENKQRRP